MMGALLLAGAAFTACSSSDDEIDQIANGNQEVTLVVRATKGTDRALTRALADEGETINATWTEGDEVVVYSGSTKIGTLTATPDATDATKATLTGSVSATLASGNSLTMKYEDGGYLQNQDGTLATIASKFDYATATVTVNPITPGETETVVTTTDADFQNQYAIVKFSLANASGPINAQVLNFINGDKYYNATLTTASSELYVAMPGISNNKLPIVVYDGTNGYRIVKEGVTFAAGKFYKVNITFGDPLSAPAGALAVDLGLVSGTTWANMNVGASSETGMGTYFAWGEVMGFNSNTDYDKYVFNVRNNVWMYGSGAQDTPVTKYTNSSLSAMWKGDGPIVKTLILEAADDAATVNWGGPWKMPTPDQFQELCDTKSDTENYRWTYCDGSTIKYNESTATGWKIEVIKDGDLNGRGNFHGNTIFICDKTNLTEESGSPAGGLSPYYTDLGTYWTSKVSTNNYPGNATAYQFFNSESAYSANNGAWNNSNRRCGMQVRPVQ